MSSPGDTESGIADLFLTRTMGLWGEVIAFSSASVGSEYFMTVSTSFTMTAKGFCFLPYHSRNSSIRSMLAHICIPPQLFAIPNFPSSIMRAKVAIGSPGIGFPSPSIRRYDGPHSGQHTVWWWNLLSVGSAYSEPQAAHLGKSFMDVLSLS